MQNQDPYCLKWQPKASNDLLSDSNKTNSLTADHQNTRDLSNKKEELISFLSPNFPQVLCLTEHHLKDSEIYYIYIYIYIYREREREREININLELNFAGNLSRMVE